MARTWAHGRQAMGQRYDLALMILGRGAPQFCAWPQFGSA